MERDLSNSRQVICMKCHRQIEMLWHDEWGAVLGVCKNCGTINFSLNAELLVYLEELYKMGTHTKEALIQHLKVAIDSRYSWLEGDLRSELAETIVCQHYDQIAFNAKVKHQEASNE